MTDQLYVLAYAQGDEFWRLSMIDSIRMLAQEVYELREKVNND